MSSIHNLVLVDEFDVTFDGKASDFPVAPGLRWMVVFRVNAAPILVDLVTRHPCSLEAPIDRRGVNIAVFPGSEKNRDRFGSWGSPHYGNSLVCGNFSNLPQGQHQNVADRSVVCGIFFGGKAARKRTRYRRRPSPRLNDKS